MTLCWLHETAHRVIVCGLIIIIIEIVGHKYIDRWCECVCVVTWWTERYYSHATQANKRGIMNEHTLCGDKKKWLLIISGNIELFCEWWRFERAIRQRYATHEIHCINCGMLMNNNNVIEIMKNLWSVSFNRILYELREFHSAFMPSQRPSIFHAVYWFQMFHMHSAGVCNYFRTLLCMK